MNKMQQIEFQYLLEQLVHDLTLMIMSDYGYDMQSAINIIYKSKTFEKMEDPDTGLYYQGSVYVYNFLKEELDLPKTRLD